MALKFSNESTFIEIVRLLAHFEGEFLEGVRDTLRDSPHQSVQAVAATPGSREEAIVGITVLLTRFDLQSLFAMRFEMADQLVEAERKPPLKLRGKVRQSKRPRGPFAKAGRKGG